MDSPPSGYVRGHVVWWDEEANAWRYEDGQLAENWGGKARPCPQCGELPSPEGYDACLGFIPGALGACCGHGRHVGYIDWPGHRIDHGWLRGAKVKGDSYGATPT